MAMYNPQMVAAALRRQPTQYPQGGGTVDRPTDRIFGANQQQARQPSQGGQQPNLGQMKENSEMMKSGIETANNWWNGGGAGGEAVSSAMPAMEAGGDSAFGSMGLQQGAVSYPGAAPVAEGGGWMSSLGSLFGGGGAEAGAGSGAGGWSAAGAGGGAAGLLAAGLLADNQLNEKGKGGNTNAERINNMGTIGDSGIGLRGGDLMNGFNPATWASDPKKAAKGLGNAFTFGLMDKII